MKNEPITFDKYAQDFSAMPPELKRSLLYGLVGSAIAGGGIGMLRHFTPKKKDETTARHTLRPALLAALAGGAAGAAIPYGAKLLSGINVENQSIPGKVMDVATWPATRFPFEAGGVLAGSYWPWMHGRLRGANLERGPSLAQKIQQRLTESAERNPLWGKTDVAEMTRAMAPHVGGDTGYLQSLRQRLQEYELARQPVPGGAGASAPFDPNRFRQILTQTKTLPTSPEAKSTYDALLRALQGANPEAEAAQLINSPVLDSAVRSNVQTLLGQYREGKLSQVGFINELNKATISAGPEAHALRADIEAAYTQTHQNRPLLRDILFGGGTGKRQQFGKLIRQLPRRTWSNLKTLGVRERELGPGLLSARWGMPVLGGVGGHVIGNVFQGED